MSKNLYWITNVDGVKAVVEGADERDRWTRVHGWALTEAPTAGELVWLRHEEHGGRQAFAAEAAPHWAGLGWHPTAPPEPADFTKDPHLVDQPAADVVSTPVPGLDKPKTLAAASGASKE